nr:uncharacterized protein LOC111515450 [Leptinotarsa decemlineata]
MEWHKEKTLYFIEKYREEEVLWNPAHPEHYNKHKKEDAWNRLASLFDSDRETCKKKMTSLLASLRREKQKTKQSTSTGKEVDEDKLRVYLIDYKGNKERSIGVEPGSLKVEPLEVDIDPKTTMGLEKEVEASEQMTLDDVSPLAGEQMDL